MNAKETAEAVAKVVVSISQSGVIEKWSTWNSFAGEAVYHEQDKTVDTVTEKIAAALIAYGNQRLEAVARMAEHNGWYADRREILAMKEKP